MTFSLIVATVGRTHELQRLLASLEAQTFKDFELIVVDQNRDGRLEPILAAFSERIIIIHLTSPLGVSRARNVGIKRAGGDIVGFPDDDCWYPPALLETLGRLFATHQQWGGLAGRIVNEAGVASGDARFDSESGYTTLSNLWRRACTNALFFRKETVNVIGGFDEELGPGAGTPWGGAEDIDYPARVIKRGRKLFYDPNICVFHPDSPTGLSEKGLARAYSYGAGIGRVWKKQAFPLSVILYYLIRPIGGALLSILMGDLPTAKYRWAAFRGRLYGWRSTIKHA